MSVSSRRSITWSLILVDSNLKVSPAALAGDLLILLAVVMSSLAEAEAEAEAEYSVICWLSFRVQTLNSVAE